MTQFTTRIFIDAPPSRVWPVMIDVERWHEWTPSITRIVKLDPGPLRVGSRARVQQPKLLPAVWQVTEVQQERSFVWVSRTPGAFVSGRHIVEPASPGSRVTLAVEYAGLIGPLLGIMFGSLTERYIAMEASGLKRRCEAQVQTSAR